MSGLIQTLNNILHAFGLPQEFIISASFYLIAALTVVFAFLVVTSKNIFHSAVFLALTLIGVAAVYLFLDAEFVAVVQILIYVGAVVTLFIFAIMLTTKISDKSIRQTNHQVLASCLVVLGLFFLLINIISSNPWRDGAETIKPLGLDQLGKSLMSTYLLPFEVISLILLAALVGAIVIGKVKRQ